MIYCGIDPGISGALAFIHYDGVVVSDTPCLTFTRGKKTVREYDIQEMVHILKDAIASASGPSIKVYLETASARPMQGVSSTCHFCRGGGIWEGILAALAIPYEKVVPAIWVREIIGPGKRDKGEHLLKAKQLFPAADIGKNHNRADALLLAEYARRDKRQ
jgi:crossover junction endodeoxyribonuclease RuvC